MRTVFILIFIIFKTTDFVPKWKQAHKCLEIVENKKTQMEMENKEPSKSEVTFSDPPPDICG